MPGELVLHIGAMAESQRFRTKKGLEYQLDVSQASPPARVDHWTYVVRATPSSGPGLTFTAILRKRAFPSVTAADAFILGDPLTEIKKRLDIIDPQLGVDMFLPDFKADWRIV